jgi:hypothetical protein|tara:strand:+ start:3493 stop:3594 length:102 start_codon:yes stop_codon:yes gene_type:complete
MKVMKAQTNEVVTMDPAIVPVKYLDKENLERKK